MLNYLFFVRDYIGESILHMWIETVREYLKQRQSTEEEVSRTAAAAEENERQIKLLDVEVEADEECPTIISGEPFTDRKSKFQGHVATVTSVAQVK